MAAWRSKRSLIGQIQADLRKPSKILLQGFCFESNGASFSELKAPSRPHG